MADYKDSFTKERKELEEFAAKIKNGTYELEKLSMKEEANLPK